MSIRQAIRYCFHRRYLKRTVRIALVVGTILTIINQGDVILNGDATTLTWVKAGLNYCVPFIVSNLGLLAGKRADLGGAGSLEAAEPESISKGTGARTGAERPPELPGSRSRLG